MIDLNDAPLQHEVLHTPIEIPLDDVKEMLVERIEDLAHELLGAGNRALSSSHQLRVNRKGSIAVEFHGDKRGEWYDHENDKGGGPLDLIKYVYGCQLKEAADWARGWLGHPADSDRKVKLRAAPTNGAAPQFSGPRPAGRQPATSATPPEPLAEPLAAPSPEDEKRRTILTTILQQCRDLTGTAGDRYLAGRGIIRRPLPPSIQFRPGAFKGFGALVAIATDADGQPRAVQQIYVTEDGAKAPVDVVKRTNKLHDNWSYHAAVRLPGTQPIVLAEGPETALSVWQATGHETWACLGVANVGHAPVADGASVIVARDGDEPGSKADRLTRKTIAGLRTRGLDVRVAQPPQGQDFNDVLKADGEERVRELIDGAAASDAYSRAWRTRLPCANDEGKAAPVLANALHALRTAPEWQGVLWHDELADRIIARRPPPWEPSDAEATWSDQRWTDRDDSLAAAWLQGEGILVGKTIASDAVIAAARDRTFHPVREYLDGLRWDGVPRVERWLSVYAGVEDNEYTRAVGQRWLISAVARAYEPGCKVDTMLILEGKQGAGKSRLLATLGRQWFSDRLSAMGSKDSMMEIATVWIVELAELDSLVRSDPSAIKNYLTSTVDHYRPVYAKHMVDQPRKCVFAGTVNPEGGYLKDPTGARRFWPVKVAECIDVDRLERDRDRLWAEAVRLYRDRFPWWFEDTELEALAQEEQEERRQPDEWEEPITEYLHNEVSWVERVLGHRERTLSPRPQPLTQVTTTELFEHAIGMPRERWSPRSGARICRVLTALGWEQPKQRERIAHEGTQRSRPRIWRPKDTSNSDGPQS